MAVRFRPAPGWPSPPSRDWMPPPGWKPDPTWPPAPAEWKFIERTGLSRGRNRLTILFVVVGFIIVGGETNRAISEGFESGPDVLIVTVAGETDEVTRADIRQMEAASAAVKEWNRLLGPPTQELIMSAPDIDVFLTAADAALREAPSVVREIQRAAGAVEHDGLRDLLMRRADVYAQELADFGDLSRAIRYGDASAEYEARGRLMFSSGEGERLAKEIVNAMHAIQDAADGN